jgi:diadenosine tetraphosphate (Ap4A) HIT family hydrolase
MSFYEHFKIKFRLGELKLLETTSWIWSVRPEQVTLGSTILSVKRPSTSFSDISPQEASEMVSLIKIIERCTKDVLAWDKLNYLMLMMNDPQVHFHIIPRYATDRISGDRNWEDHLWPAPPDLRVTQGSAQDVHESTAKLKFWISQQGL